MNGSPKVSLSNLMTLLCARLLTQGPANTGGIRGRGDRLIFIEGRDRMQGSSHLGLILYLLGLIFMVMSCFHGQISVQKNRINILSRRDMYRRGAIITCS